MTDWWPYVIAFGPLLFMAVFSRDEPKQQPDKRRRSLKVRRR